MALDKKKIIIVMCAVIGIMAVGYALFSSTLNITGSTSIASNWLIEFTKIEEKSKTSGVEILGGPTASGTTATFNVNLKGPGDKIVYDITVENKGSLDAVVNKINASETGSEAFYFNITGIKEGDELASYAKKVITIEIGYDPSVTEQPTDLKNRLTMDIEFVQDFDQSINGEDITIQGPALTTLSGNNALTLENSAGRALANYIIKGNSVQNGTPTPTAPVEIQNVGNKTKNLFDINNYSVGGTPNFEIKNGHIIGSFDWDNRLTYKISNLDPNSQYTFSFNRTSSSATFWYSHDSRGNYLSQSTQNATLTPNSKGEITIIFSSGDNGQYITYDIYNLQLEKSSSKTSYEPYGYKVPVEVSGKNLINIEQGLNQALTTDNNGIYTIAKNDSGRFSANISINLKANTTYVMSYELIDTNSTYFLPFQISWANQNVGIRENQNYVVFTPTTDITSISIYQESQMPVGTYTTFKNLQIEEGKVPTKYEPYVESKTYYIYLDEPLRCVSDICDYIDFENKKVVRQVGVKKVSSTSHNWGRYSNNTWGASNAYRAIFSDMREIKLGGTMENNYVLSNAFNEGAYVSMNLATGTGWSEAKYVYFRFDGDNYGVTSIDTFKSLLDSNNIYVYYPLGENYIKNNSIDLPTIYTTEGTSTISVINDNGLEVPLEVKYYKMNES